MKLMIPLVLGFSIFVLIYASFGSVISPDLYWHLRIGSDWLFHGLNPFVDHYSFTFEGARQHQLTLPFDVLAAVMFKYFGYFGIGLMRFSIWSIGIVIMNHILIKEKVSPIMRAFGLSLFVYSAVSRYEPRPELLSVPLELWTLILMQKWQASPSWRKTVGLCALLLFWTNMHASAAFGFLIVGSLLAESAFFALKSGNKVVFRMAIFSGLLIFSMGFVNPDLFHPLLLPLKFDPRWRLYIGEFIPMDFAQFDLPFRVFYALVVIALPGLILLRRYGAVLLVLALALENLHTVKILMHSIPIATPFIILSYDFYFKKFSAMAEKKAAVISEVILGIVTVVIFFKSFQFVSVPFDHLQNQTVNNYFPQDTVEYMKNSNMKGRILSEYGLGGFVLFELYPDVKVYIDGRTNMVYPFDFFAKYLAAIYNPADLISDTKKYDIDYILVDYKFTKFSETVMATKMYTLDFVGSNSNLFVKKGGRFKHTMYQLYRPECVLSKPDRRLKAEQDLIRNSLPQASALRIYMALIELYQNSKNKAELFDDYHWDWAINAPLARLSANLAGREKKWKAKLYYLGVIKDDEKSATDRLDRAETFCRLDKCDRAEDDLDVATDMPLNDSEKFRAAELLRELKSKASFKFFKESKYEKIQKYVVDYTKAKGQPKAPDNCEKKL